MSAHLREAWGRLTATKMYHVAPNRFRDSIEEKGLIEGMASGIWLWGDRERADDPDAHFDLWEIDVDGLEIYPGHEGSMEWGEDDPVFVVFQTIPPSRLKRVPTRYDMGVISREDS